MSIATFHSSIKETKKKKKNHKHQRLIDTYLNLKNLFLSKKNHKQNQFKIDNKEISTQCAQNCKEKSSSLPKLLISQRKLGYKDQIDDQTMNNRIKNTK